MHSDPFRVELHLSAVIKDKAFAIFLESEQRDLPEEERLSVFEVMALNQIRMEKSEDVEKSIIKGLLERGLIEKRGKTSGTYYILSKSYYECCGKEGEYSKNETWTADQAFPMIMAHFSTFKTAKMKDFVSILDSHMSRKQVRNTINLLVEKKILSKEGVGSGTVYSVSENYINNSIMISKALEIGLEELKRRGEIK